VSAQVADGVTRMGTEIVNWYLVEDGGRLTAVDCGLPGYGRSLETDLRAAGYNIADIEAVVLTHSDSDHMGMAAQMRDAGARVLIHEQDEPTLRKPGPKSGDASPAHAVPLMWRPAFWRFMGHMARRGGAKAPAVEGAERFTDGAVLDVPGKPRAVHTPGHTNGHCVLVFDSHGALFAGDELCTWNPITGERGPRLMPKQFDVSYDQCVESLTRFESLDAELILPGHGHPWAGTPAAAAARAREAAGA
jgi:glyoxylase-like metal-dependent hydrolase (beta-lactamase superfamily II)